MWMREVELSRRIEVYVDTRRHTIRHKIVEFEQRIVYDALQEPGTSGKATVRSRT
jgi:hypothetical protein